MTRRRRTNERSLVKPSPGAGQSVGVSAPEVSGMRGIITGASRGLGLALTRALSERGWQLAVDARGAEALEHAVAGLAGVVAVSGDVADPDHRRRLVEAAGEPIDLLVNNASLLGPSPLPPLGAILRSRSCGACTRRTCSRRSRSSSSRCRDSLRSADRQPRFRRGLRGVRAWGGYGSSKAALAQITRGARRRASGPPRLRRRPRRHAHADAAGRLPR